MNFPMITFFRLSDLASLWPKTGATHCHARGIGLSDKRRTIRGLNIYAIVIIFCALGPTINLP